MRRKEATHMRVIAGKAKSLPLKTIEGLDTRPTTDRIKETLFNMLQPDIPGCKFLDLFSGSGAIGIEALSRDAAKAYFVESNRKSAECIRENLAFTHLADNAVVMDCDAITSINRLAGKEVFDVIFMDPPYNMEHEKNVLEALSKSDIIDKYTLIIIEASLTTDFDYLDSLDMEVVKEKKYKTNKHMFVRLK